MKQCDKAKLSFYLDRELEQPELQELEVHLNRCSSCRSDLTTLRGVDRELVQWGSRRTPVPGSLNQRMAQTVERRRRLAPLITLSRMTPAAVGSCVAAVLVMLSVNFGMLYKSTPSVAPTASPAKGALQKQSATLVKARQVAALLGSDRDQVSAPRVGLHTELKS